MLWIYLRHNDVHAGHTLTPFSMKDTSIYRYTKCYGYTHATFTGVHDRDMATPLCCENTPIYRYTHAVDFLGTFHVNLL